MQHPTRSPSFLRIYPPMLLRSPRKTCIPTERMTALKMWSAKLLLNLIASFKLKILTIYMVLFSRSWVKKQERCIHHLKRTKNSQPRVFHHMNQAIVWISHLWNRCYFNLPERLVRYKFLCVLGSSTKRIWNSQCIISRSSTLLLGHPY